MNKEILAAQRIDKEREEAIAIELRKKEKQDFLRAKHKMLLQLEMDRCERKGILYNEEEALARIMKKEEKPPIEDIKQGIKTVKTLYTEERPQVLPKPALKLSTSTLATLSKIQMIQSSNLLILQMKHSKNV
jgi:hypothetical protein